MNQLGVRMRTTTALLLLGVVLPGKAAMAQSTLKDQIVGTWRYVSVDLVRPDGTRVPLFGPNPQGQASFDSNGRYILMKKPVRFQTGTEPSRNDRSMSRERSLRGVPRHRLAVVLPRSY